MPDELYRICRDSLMRDVPRSWRRGACGGSDPPDSGKTGFRASSRAQKHKRPMQRESVVRV